jgi:uncharacterized membrane protein YozB (DUF420 family)
MTIYLEMKGLENMSNSLITLLIYVLGLLPLMLLGYFFARRKMFRQHKLTMTSIFIANWLLIFWVMSPSYRNMVTAVPDPDYSSIPVILPTIHMVLGALAQLMATYLVLLMWTERTPLEKLIPIRIKNIKTPMRITLSLWIATVLLGLGIYATWYGFDSIATSPESTEVAPDPNATEEATEAAPSPDATEESVEEAPEEPATTEEA